MRFLKMTRVNNIERENEIINTLNDMQLTSTDIFLLRLISDKRDPMWSLISKYNIMDEGTILKHMSTLDVDMIQTYQPITLKFVKKHLDLINPFFVTSNTRISNEEYEKIIDYILLRGANVDEINWVEASSRVLSLEFISRYRRYIKFEFMYYDYQNSGSKLDFIRNSFPIAFNSVEADMKHENLDGITYLVKSVLLFDAKTLHLELNQQMKTSILVDNFIERFISDKSKVTYFEHVKEIMQRKLA